MTRNRFRRRRRRPAFRGDFDDDGYGITEVLQAAAPAPWDGTTIEFTGASIIGLPDGAYPVAGGQRGQDTEPLARLRARGQQPATFPALPPAPPAPPARQPEPQPVMDRLPAVIGDALALDAKHGPRMKGKRLNGPSWADIFASLPCGHCGAAPGTPAAGKLDRDRVIGHLNWLALQAGWKHDVDLTWTCPACQQDDEWKARQGQLEVRGGTAKATALAVDVMLTSHDYLNTGRALSLQLWAESRGRHTGGTS